MAIKDMTTLLLINYLLLYKEQGDQKAINEIAEELALRFSKGKMEEYIIYKKKFGYRDLHTKKLGR